MTNPGYTPAPHSPEAGQLVLGVILLRPQAMARPHHIPKMAMSLLFRLWLLQLLIPSDGYFEPGLMALDKVLQDLEAAW